MIDTLKNMKLPDYSTLVADIKTDLSISQQIHEFNEIIHSLAESLKQLQHEITESSQKLFDSIKPIKVCGKLGDAQFVQWQYMDESFVDVIFSSDNIDETLQSLLIKEEYKSAKETIDLVKIHPLMKNHVLLFEQSGEAFMNGRCNLAVLGLTAVFDGVLASVTQNQTHKLSTRVDSIKARIEADEFLVNDEYAMISLALTLEKALTSFTVYAPFENPEPQTLNRNWIAHGRSNKQRTELDCVKIINMIYGLLLLNDKIE